MLQRENIQREAKESWLNAPRRRNSVILPTGTGKSKVAIDIIKELRPSSILLLSNSELLRDKNWKDEFIKFDALDIWNQKVTSECYQTMCRREGTWDMIVMDEVDFIVGTEEYSKCFNLQSNTLLCMTGFITDEKREILQTIAPICYEVDLHDLQDTDVLNRSELILLEYPLNKTKTIKQTKKDGSFFMVSENDQYRYYDKEFTRAMIAKSKYEQAHKFFDSNYQEEQEYKSLDWRFKITATKRKSILQNLDSSVTLVHNLINKIHSAPGNKILIFSALTKQCDRLMNPFHGKNEQDFSGIEELNSGRVTTMSVVKKITRGMNLIGVNYIIRESYDGSEVDFMQSHGRGLRLAPGQVMKYIFLLPYYEDIVKLPTGAYRKQVHATQADTWVNKATKYYNGPVKRIKLDNLIVPHGIL